MSDKENAIQHALQNLHKAKGSLHIHEGGKHRTDGKKECWCNPEVRYVDGITDKAVIIHKTLQ